MVRLYFTVEGPTEQRFVRLVLKPHLELKQIYCQSILPAAHCKRKVWSIEEESSATNLSKQIFAVR